MPKKNFPDDIRKLALSYPGTSEAVSCNKAAFKAAKKSFLFLGETDEGWNLMIKLADSLGEAEAFETRNPDNCSVGKHGWVTLRFPTGKGPSKTQLKNWVDESFRLLAPKKLLAERNS